jgi:Ca2+-binding EF-hand superfamily protein
MQELPMNTPTTSRYRSARRLAAAAVGALALGAAVAAVAGPSRPEFPISLTDARERAEARFRELDVDGSGDLSAEELANAPHARFMHGLGKRQGAQLADGSHRWLEKHGGDLETDLFERLDQDGDGQISRDEFDAGALAEARRDAMRQHVFARLDRDGSGGITPDELPDPVRRLEAMDADGDGIVTREEARAYKQERRQARREAREAEGRVSAPGRREGRTAERG